MSTLVYTDGDPAPRRDGRRLDHAEGASRPIHIAQPEPQPRGAHVHGNRPIDQNEAAGRFIAAPEHESMHDQRLWDLRQKRDNLMHGIPEWETLRDLASQIKEHTLTHLADYLEQFEANATANGVHVHWARDGAEHNQTVLGILRDHGARSLVKSKSMLTEETGFRPFMAANGVEVTECDLGERIQQLDDESPSHIVVPAVHKLRTDVAAVFARKLGTDPQNSDPKYLARQQREATRPLFLNADAGLTGANFAVAETGGFTVCTNEGNADLASNVPKLHIASIGIEKLVPRLDHLAVMIRLLSRSALGSPMTQYTSHFRGPHAGAEMHIVLTDNGRSARLALEEFWTSLKCIRCGACMNTCPVYRRSGGLSYGATYSGPIGLIIDPTFNRTKYSTLPFSSTLNGSCTNVCPVKINIHEQIAGWRKVMSEEHELPIIKKTMMRAAGAVLARPAVYRASIKVADSAVRNLPRFAIYNPLNTWTRGRAMPHAPAETFHDWHRKKTGAPSHDRRARRDPGCGAQKPPTPARDLPAVPMFDDIAHPALPDWFRENLEKMGGEWLEPAGNGDALATLRARIGDAAVVVSTTPQYAGTRDVGDPTDPRRLDDVDFAVVRGAFAVAETGSILFTEAELRTNALGYLPQHLIVLVDPADIVLNIPHAYARPEFRQAHYAVFHTGPSATADVEGVLIHGAQGVRSLAVLLHPR